MTQGGGDIDGRRRDIVRRISVDRFSHQLSRTGNQRVVEIALLWVSCPHQRNLLLRKAALISVQYAVEGNILQRVIQYPQKMQKFLYLSRRKVSRARSDIDGNAFLLQHPLKDLIPAGKGAQENHDVAKRSPSQRPRLLIRQLEIS